MLAYTGDNASNNDAMVDHLEFMNVSFEGQKRRVRCVLHTNSLAARAITKQFDVSASKNSNSPSAADEALRELAEGLEDDDLPPLLDFDDDDKEEEEEEEEEGGFQDDDDDDEGTNEVDRMSDRERAEHEDSVRPMKLVLAKVSSCML